MGLANLFAVADAYAEYININNMSIDQFPDIIVARFVDFKARYLLEFSIEEIRNINLRLCSDFFLK